MKTSDMSKDTGGREQPYMILFEHFQSVVMAELQIRGVKKNEEKLCLIVQTLPAMYFNFFVVF